MMIATSLNARSPLHTSSPFLPGSIRSRSTRSTSCVPTHGSTSSPRCSTVTSKPSWAQVVAQQPGELRLVLDDQDAVSHAVVPVHRGNTSLIPRPPSGLAVRREGAAVALDDGPRDGQPEPGAAAGPTARGLDPVQPLGQARQVLGRRRRARCRATRRRRGRPRASPRSRSSRAHRCSAGCSASGSRTPARAGSRPPARACHPPLERDCQAALVRLAALESRPRPSARPRGPPAHDDTRARPDRIATACAGPRRAASAVPSRGRATRRCPG